MKMSGLVFVILLLVYAPLHAVTGDLDNDGDVDFDDFFVFADNFGKEGPIDECDCGEVIPSTPLEFTGTGTQTTEKFKLESGLRVIRVTKTPATESIFVSMLDGITGDRFSDGGISDIDDMSEISKSFQVEGDEAGAFVINVDSGGEWTITIDDGEKLPSILPDVPIVLTGIGTQTTSKFQLTSGLRTIRVTKTPATESIFITMLNSESGDRFLDGSLSDIDDMGDVSKSFQVESDEVGEYVVNVETGGEWTITIE
jgi:hypothetical protein